ncbi:hypothetical protein AB1484_26975, partial [Parafrankia sp. FMc6]
MPYPVMPPGEWVPEQIPGQLREEFTGADGDIETPARTWLDWEALAGAGQIVGNQATGTTASGTDVFRCASALSHPDHSVEIEITALDAAVDRAAGVWLRMGAGASLAGYQVQVSEQADEVRIVRWEAGVATDISGPDGALAVPLVVPCVLRAEIDDTALRVYVDNALVWQGTDSTASLATNTAVGLDFTNANSTATVTTWQAVELGSLLLEPDTIVTTATVGAPAFLSEAEQIAGLIASWDAADLAGLADGAPVSSWPVHAGVETAPLAAVGAARPVYRTNRVNGQGAVAFTAGLQNSLDTGGWSRTYPVPLTVIVVHRWTTLSAWMDLWSGRNLVYTHASARPARLTVGAGTAGQVDDPTSLSTSGWHIAGVVFNGSDTRTFYDSMTSTGSGTTGTGPAAGLPGLILGASSTRNGAWLNGEITEILVIGRAVADAEMAGLLGDRAQKYALPWAPPPGEEGPPDPPLPGAEGAPDALPEPTVEPGVPTPHLGIVFDSGPLELLTLPSTALGPYSTFDVATIASLPAIIWGAGTSPAISTVAPQAGATHLAITRTGSAGDISFILGIDFGDVAASGRNYLIWLPNRPAPGEPNRTVRVSATWLDTDEEVLSSDLIEQEQGTGYVTQEGYTWPGLRTTAPDGARHLVLGALVEGCDLGETHFVDSWPIRQFGVNVGSRLRARRGETRGRNSDLADFEAGTGKFVLNNHDGLFTPGGDGYPVDLRQQVTLVWELDGLLYPGGVFYTDEWTNIPHADGVGDVQVDCVDGFELLAPIKLLPPHQAEIIYRAVGDSYLPLTEESGSRTAGDIAGDGGTAFLRAATAGTGGSDFGGQSFNPKLSSGHTGDGDATVLAFNDGDLTGGKGDVLEVTGLTSAIPKRGQGWTFLVRLAIPASTGQYQIIYRNALESNLPYLPGFQISVTPTGRIEVSAYSAVVIETPFRYDVDTPYSLAVTYDPTVGRYGRIRIQIYGSDISATLTNDPFSVVGTPTRAYLGGTYTPIGGNLTFPFRGRIQHVLFANRVLPDAIITYLEQHISQGAPESESVRAATICEYAGFALPYTRFDKGLSVLLAAHWADRTSLLQALRTTLGHAAGQLMMSADGRVMAHNRLHRATPTPRFVFAGGQMSPARAGLSPRLDRSRLANTIVVSRPRGARYRLVDKPSRSKYGEVEAPARELHVQSDQEVYDHGRAVLRARATPRSEIKTVEFDLAGRPQLARALLCLELGDYITAGDLPDTAGAAEIAGFVDKIESWSDGPLRAMRMRLSLSPVTSALTYGDVPGQDPTTPTP